MKGTEYMHLSRYPSRAGPAIVPWELALPGIGYVKRLRQFEEPVASGSKRGVLNENQR